MLVDVCVVMLVNMCVVMIVDMLVFFSCLQHLCDKQIPPKKRDIQTMLV